MKFLMFCLLLSVIHPSLALADFSGPIVSVLDGDTIEVLRNQRLAHKKRASPLARTDPADLGRSS
jgi:hypothetical protein